MTMEDFALDSTGEQTSYGHTTTSESITQW